MRGLGRLLALPWLLIALAAQALAPAESAAMRPDPGGTGICSAHGLGGAPHRPLPARDNDHDCCAFACALTGVAAVPPVHATPIPVAFAAPAGLAAAHSFDAPTASPFERPHARGPPSSILTT